MLWYVLERYVEHDSIKTYLGMNDDGDEPQYTFEQIHITKPVNFD